MNPILQLRKRLKASQVQMGKAIGVSQSAVSQYEKGRATPSPDVVRRLIEFAKTRGVEVSFEWIYAPNDQNGPIDSVSSSDDTQPPVGRSSRKLAKKRK